MSMIRCKKLLTLAIGLVLSTMLTGCVYEKLDVTVKSDLSGSYVGQKGFDAELFESGIAEVSDAFGEEATQTVSQGEHSYYVKSVGGSFSDAAGLQEALSTKGDIQLIKLDDGGVRIILQGDVFEGPEVEDYGDVSYVADLRNDPAVIGMEEYLDEGRYMHLNIELPYNVEQIIGSGKGVYINGNRLTLLLHEMDDDNRWVFESREDVGKTEQPLERMPTEVNISKHGRPTVPLPKLGDLPEITSSSFRDVDMGAWYAKPVNLIARAGIVSGYGQQKFGPEDQLTVPQLFAILARSMGLDEEPRDHEFWGAPYIRFADQWNLYLGDLSDACYDRGITREEAVYAMVCCRPDMVRYMTVQEQRDVQSRIKDFADVNYRYRDAITLAYDAGMVNGNSRGEFDPKKVLTRAEMCQILYNISWVQVLDNGEQLLQWYGD